MLESKNSDQPVKCYRHPGFPLVPIFTIHGPDKYNTGGFNFRWLIFRMWSLETFQFEISLNIDTHWGIGVTALFPYLRFVACIPLPEKVCTWMDNLRRKPRTKKPDNGSNN